MTRWSSRRRKDWNGLDFDESSVTRVTNVFAGKYNNDLIGVVSGNGRNISPSPVGGNWTHTTRDDLWMDGRQTESP